MKIANVKKLIKKMEIFMSQQSSNLKRYYNSQPIDYQLIMKEFKKTIYENIFHINKDFLLLNSDLVSFNVDKWKMRPEFFCDDHYKHPFIFPVVLLSNNLKSIFEFIPENLRKNYIIAPKLIAIKRILQNRIGE